jgi:hypothetical protein
MMETILGAIAQSTGERPSFCAPAELRLKNFRPDLFSDFLRVGGASAGGLRAFVN